MRELEDFEVVARALTGDERAYREIVARFERPVFSVVVRIVRDPGTAEDLTQDTFVKAFGALARFDPRHRFSSWIFKIAHNTSIDHLRHRQLATVSLDATDDTGDRALADRLEDPTAVDPEAQAQNQDLAADLEAALAELRPEYREVVVLRFQEGLAYEEIAEVLSLPLGTVKTFIHRARKDLAVRMGRRGYQPSTAGETRREANP